MGIHDIDTSTSEPKFPEVVVRLTGEDGNVFAIMGRVEAALKKAGATTEQIKAFCADMAAGDYDDALRAVKRWVHTT
jgi:hypothetical protein